MLYLETYPFSTKITVQMYNNEDIKDIFEM
jgi:hypothetical protein